jgi:hypothetical protein
MIGSVAGRLVVAAALSVCAAAPLAAATAAQTRGTAQRQQRAVNPQTDVSDEAAERQGRLLLDRFAERIGNALRLDAGQTRRLQRELQSSRLARARIAAQSRVVRQELARLVQESSTDEVRIAELIDETVRLEVQAAEVSVDEQARLSQFLSPVQRARVMWLRQRLARQALEQGRRPDGF